MSSVTAIRKTMISLVQPAMVAAALLFWAFGPASWTNSPWSIVVATSLTTASVLGLEFLHERHSSWRMNWREFRTDLYYLILNYTLIGWCTKFLADEPMTAFKQSLGITTEWAMQMPFVLQVVLVVFLVEFGQYWMHRLMHAWAPFWLTHAPHHHITQLNATKGTVGNPIELFLISLSVVALFDVPLPAAFCGFNILAIVSTFAHANTRFDPPRWYAFFFTTVENHSLHHSVGYENTRCNYGNSLILLDRIFGTYRDGEAEEVGQDERKRLTIWQQTVFPFMPLVEKVRASRGRSQSVVG